MEAISNFGHPAWRWRNEPGTSGSGNDSWKLEEGGTALVVRPAPQLDYWSKTYYTPNLVKHDGQALLASVAVSA